MNTGRQKITLDQPDSNRLNLYGGVLDLVNISGGSKQLERDLKFAALFYKHILVPDSFFHCYGPLYSHFAKLFQAGNVQAIETDTIVKFLRAGIIVPVLRIENTLFDNWQNEVEGIEKGKHLMLKEEDGANVLEKVDKYWTKFALWPESMKDSTKTKFGQQFPAI